MPSPGPAGKPGSWSRPGRARAKPGTTQPGTTEPGTTPGRQPHDKSFNLIKLITLRIIIIYLFFINFIVNRVILFLIKRNIHLFK